LIVSDSMGMPPSSSSGGGKLRYDGRSFQRAAAGGEKDEEDEEEEQEENWETESEESEEEHRSSIAVGAHVMVREDMAGIVRFIGEVHYAKGQKIKCIFVA
jgi:hypothetical protein